MCHAGSSSNFFFSGMLNSGDGDLQTVLLDGLKRQMSKACIDGSDSLIFHLKRHPCVSKYKSCGYMASNRSRFSKY